MREFLLGAIMALALAVPAWAGDASAAAPKPVDSHMAAAMDLLQANGSLGSVGALLDALAPIQALEIQHEQPNLSAAQIASIQAAIKNEFMARIDELERIVAAGYVDKFSEDELRTLAAFYRSDVGKKYVETVPTLVKSLAPAETAWALSVARDAVLKLSKDQGQGTHT